VPPHVVTDFKMMQCTRCNQRQDIPSMPLDMVLPFLKSFGKLHKNCDGKAPAVVEIEYQRSSEYRKLAGN